MKLLRIKDLPPDFPLGKSALYKMHHYGRYPKLLVKLAGALCVDMDELPNVVRGRDIPLRKVKKVDA